MTPLRRLVLLALIAIVGVVSSGPGASSIENETYGVTPYPQKADGVDRGAFKIPLETGETFEDAIRIYNKTTQSLELTVYAADAEAGAGETDISPVTVGLRNQEPKGLGSWIDLARENVQLAPRDEVIISFRVQVKAADPAPPHGAIVVEMRRSGSGDAARESLNVLSVAGGTPTSSERVRPLLLRSPWIIVAVLGLLLAIALVWIGARRARRPKDVLVPAGEIEQPEIEDGIPDASRPVIRRLGAPEPEPPAEPIHVPTRPGSRSRRGRDGAPLIEDAFLVEVEPDEDEEVEAEDLAEPMSDDTDDDITFIEPRYLDDEDDEEEDELPPARHRPAAAGSTSTRSSSTSKGTSKERATAKKKPVRPTAKKPAPKRKKAPVKKTAAKRKPAPRSRTPKRSDPPAGYIPLDDL